MKDLSNDNHICEFCAITFSTSYFLKKHIREVHKNNCTSCESCGRTFQQVVELRAHFHTVHDGQRIYKCDHCDKSFSAKKFLRLHFMNYHARTEDRKHRCNIC